MTVKLITERVTKVSSSMGGQPQTHHGDTEQWENSHLGWNKQDSWEFIRLLRIVHNLKLTNYFCNFSFNMFRLLMTEDS